LFHIWGEALKIKQNLNSYILYLSISVTIVSLCLSNQKVLGAADTFSADGAISSIIFGMPPSTSTVNMSSVQKFILSGYWQLSTEKGKVSNFTSDFYTGPVNGANNHTHQLSNLRLVSDVPIQLSADGSTKIIGLLNVGTNGKNAWNDVHTTITISNGRTITLTLADNDTQRHFMNQPIYGIVKHVKTG
jgi:hypothetical protein